MDTSNFQKIARHHLENMQTDEGPQIIKHVDRQKILDDMLAQKAHKEAQDRHNRAREAEDRHNRARAEERRRQEEDVFMLPISTISPRIFAPPSTVRKKKEVVPKEDDRIQNINVEKVKTVKKNKQQTCIEKFDLDDFLKDYAPKAAESKLRECLREKKLKGYGIYSTKTAKKLVAGKTYIKYLKNTANYNLKMLQSGGIFMGGGVSLKSGFKTLEDPNKWAHMMLKICKENDDGIVDPYIFVIKITNFHVFYKLFDEVIKNANMREIIVELERNIS